MQAPFPISPSLLAYHDWVEFKSLLDHLDHQDIDGLHIDVMDGHFVPNLAYGPDLVRSIKSHTRHPLDLHLMISCLDVLLPRYIALQPRTIFIHPEVSQMAHIHLIKSANIQVGFAIHPDYPIEQTQPFWPLLDRMLIMTVIPGFAGQDMMPQHLQKITYLKDHGYAGLCWADGGVTPDTFQILQDHQVDGVIMGNSYFSAMNI